MTQQKMAYHVSRCDTVILLCVEVAMIQSITADTDLTILTGKDVYETFVSYLTSFLQQTDPATLIVKRIRDFPRGVMRELCEQRSDYQNHQERVTISSLIPKLCCRKADPNFSIVDVFRK